MEDIAVLQSNALTESAYTLTLQQKRLVMLSVLNANKYGNASVSVDQFSKFYGIRKNHAKNFFISAKDSIISANVLIKTDDGFILTNWFDSIIFNETSATIDILFTRIITNNIAELKNKLTVYSILDAGRMKNFYFIRLYIYLCQWRATGLFSIDVERLRSSLSLPKSYGTYANMKNKFLIPACNNITENTNFIVRFEEIKKGRKISKIDFIFYEKIPFKLTKK